MPIAVNNLIGQTFNDLYAQRPVWAIASNTASTGAAAPVVALYGEASPYNPLNVEYPGSARARTRSFTDEMANAGYTFCGNASASSSSNGWSPSSGYFGINVNTQTGCLNNFDAFDNGNYGWYGTNSDTQTLASVSGIVVGESNWRQTYDLILNNSGRLFKEEIGGSYTSATTGNRPFIDLVADLTGGQFPSVAGNPWGWGQIAHNRNSGRLLIAQPNGGSNGTSLTFRLHFFDLQLKIGRATTIAQIKAAMQACIANGSGRYRYTDVVFNNARCYFSSNTSYDSIDTQFVLCDNDEVWAFKSSECANTGSQYGNALFRVNLSGGTWLTGTYAATFAVGFNGTTQYGLTNNGHQYGVRHTNSDDNSVIALYQHYYYYSGGYHIAFVSSKNAGATSYNYAVADSSEAYTIAPCGGAGFVLCHSSYNNDSYGPRIGLVDNQILNATLVTPSFTGYMYPSLNSSTCYGGNMVLKVQPTTEWK